MAPKAAGGGVGDWSSMLLAFELMISAGVDNTSAVKNSVPVNKVVVISTRLKDFSQEIKRAFGFINWMSNLESGRSSASAATEGGSSCRQTFLWGLTDGMKKAGSELTHRLLSPAQKVGVFLYQQALLI